MFVVLKGTSDHLHSTFVRQSSKNGGFDSGETDRVSRAARLKNRIDELIGKFGLKGLTI